MSIETEVGKIMLKSEALKNKDCLDQKGNV